MHISRDFQTVFQSCWINVHSHKAVCENSSTPHPQNYALLSVLFIVIILVSVVISYCGFDWISLLTKKSCRTIHVCSPFGYALLWSSSSSLLPIFSYWLYALLFLFYCMLVFIFIYLFCCSLYHFLVFIFFELYLLCSYRASWNGSLYHWFSIFLLYNISI